MVKYERNEKYVEERDHSIVCKASKTGLVLTKRCFVNLLQTITICSTSDYYSVPRVLYPLPPFFIFSEYILQEGKEGREQKHGRCENRQKKGINFNE